jgi:hypothetical protein
MRGPNEQRHVCVVARQVINRWISLLFEPKRLRRFSDDPPGDLKRFSIYTVLVDEYSQITELLQRVAAVYKRSSIFISGAAENYGSWARADAEGFLHKLSHQIGAKKNRIITGFGVGVGGAVINGALAYLNEAGKTISDEDIVMRPFPQVATGTASLPDQWTEYRKAMIDYAGIAFFVFGNKRNDNGEIVLSNGMRQEFDLCIKAGVHPLPVGATGFMAAELWEEVRRDMAKFYPDATAAFRADFEQLGDVSKSHDELSFIAVITDLQPQVVEGIRAVQFDLLISPSDAVDMNSKQAVTPLYTLHHLIAHPAARVGRVRAAEENAYRHRVA